MVIKIVPLPVHQGIKFDMILPDHYVVTLMLDEYEIRHYGPETMQQVIQLRVEQWLRDNDYDDTGLYLIFC